MSILRSRYKLIPIISMKRKVQRKRDENKSWSQSDSKGRFIKADHTGSSLLTIEGKWELQSIMFISNICVKEKEYNKKKISGKMSSNQLIYLEDGEGWREKRNNEKKRKKRRNSKTKKKKKRFYKLKMYEGKNVIKVNTCFSIFNRKVSRTEKKNNKGSLKMFKCWQVNNYQ